MTTSPIVLPSLSAAMDGGFTAIHDISRAVADAGAADEYRLIGGVAVMLHVQRVDVDVPLRATGDADFGVPPYVLRSPDLVAAIEALDYRKVAGNRWERQLDTRRTAAVDLLIPSYRTRARDTVRVGDVVTTEVPGLAEALRRPGIPLDVQFQLGDGARLDTTVVLPDAVGMIALKTLVHTVRIESRDVEDLWRCLEVARADGTTPADFDDGALPDVRRQLWRQLGPDGVGLVALTESLQPEAAARLRTRLRALLTEVAGEA